MPHETALLATLALGLAFACAGGWVALRLGLPPLLGYLFAGIVVGPFTPGLVADAKIAAQLAEIGVILLMFGVGMHFSFRDLIAVRMVAVPGAFAQIAVATALGALVAYGWGWSPGAGLVFGLAMSVASTVVLLRALEGRGSLHTGEGRIAVGWLVVEDLVMVLALVLLPPLAGVLGGSALPDVAAGRPWMTLLATVGKIALFVGLMLVVGARLFPWLLRQVERTGSQELFTLAVIALALGVAFASAELFGVSFALGAFFAGGVIHTSDLGHRAENNLRPLQDAFAALFFVAVGMLFDPRVLFDRPLQVLAVVAIIVLGKSLAALAIVRALGHPPRTALTVAAALAQIGEFSFILAGLGVSLGLLPPEGEGLVVTGALLSITLNPLVWRAAVRSGTRPGGDTGRK